MLVELLRGKAVTSVTAEVKLSLRVEDEVPFVIELFAKSLQLILLGSLVLSSPAFLYLFAELLKALEVEIQHVPILVDHFPIDSLLLRVVAPVGNHTVL